VIYPATTMDILYPATTLDMLYPATQYQCCSYQPPVDALSSYLSSHHNGYALSSHHSGYALSSNHSTSVALTSNQWML